MDIQRYFSGTNWEEKAGYCRALKVGNHIYVSGTAPIDDQGQVFAPGDAYAQTRFCLEKIQTALQNLGADLNNIVRVRLFVTDISRTEEYIQAHKELLGEYPPTNTLVAIQALVEPTMLVEVEAEAIC